MSGILGVLKAKRCQTNNGDLLRINRGPSREGGRKSGNLEAKVEASQEKFGASQKSRGHKGTL